MKKRTNVKEKRDKGFPADHLVRIIYGICMLAILMLCFFFAGIHYVHKCDTALNLLLCPAGAAGSVFLYAL